MENTSPITSKLWASPKFWADRRIVIPAIFQPDIQPFNPTLNACTAFEKSKLQCNTCYNLAYQRDNILRKALLDFAVSANQGC